MTRQRIIILIIISLSLAIIISVYGDIFDGGVSAQIPTVSLPTVTGSPQGPVVSVRRDSDQDNINVRSGPSAKYDIVGVLID